MPKEIRKLKVNKIKSMTVEEVKRFLAAIERSKEQGNSRYLRDRTMFTLMYLYGLRCLEAADMTTDDIDMGSSRIYIAAAKNGHSGFYHLKAEIKPLLRQYLAWRNQQGYKSPALFVSSKTGKFLDTRQVRRLFADYAKDARIPLDKRHPHVLRHSIAVHMADSKVDVAVVQMHLRHKDLRNTMKYFTISSKKRDEIQEKALDGDSIANIW